MKILMDVDGVVADTANHLFDLLGISQEERKKFRKWAFLSELSEEDEKRGRALLKDPHFWETIPLMEGAKRGIREIKHLGHRITWLTAPYTSCPEWGAVRRRWVNRNFGGGEPVIIEKEKEKIDGDALIDDKPDNIRKWYKARPLGHAVLFDTQFNRDFEWRTRANWSNMIKTLKWL